MSASHTIKKLNPTSLDEIEYLLVNELTDKQFYKFMEIIANTYTLGINIKYKEEFNPSFLQKCIQNSSVYISSSLRIIGTEYKRLTSCMQEEENNNSINSTKNHFDNYLILNAMKNDPHHFLEVYLKSINNYVNNCDGKTINITNTNVRRKFLILFCNFKSYNDIKNLEPIQFINQKIRFYTELFYMLCKIEHLAEFYKAPIYDTTYEEFMIDYICMHLPNKSIMTQPLCWSSLEINETNEIMTNELIPKITEFIIILNDITKVNYLNSMQREIYRFLYIKNKFNIILQQHVINYFNNFHNICNNLITMNDIEILFYKDNTYYISYEKYELFNIILLSYEDNQNLNYDLIFKYISVLLSGYNLQIIKSIYNKFIYILTHNNVNDINNDYDNDNDFEKYDANDYDYDNDFEKYDANDYDNDLSLGLGLSI